MPIDIPLPLAILKRYDFTDSKRFDSVFGQLLRRLRGERPERGQPSQQGSGDDLLGTGQEEPTGGSEVVISNLLPAVSLPEWIWGDETTITNRKEIFSKTDSEFPFVVDGGKLFSFCDPHDRSNPFSSILTGRFRQKQKTSTWFADALKRPRLVQLLNAGLANHCYHLNIRRTEQGRDSFFVPCWGGKTRTFTWGKGRGRTLAKLAKGPNEQSFGVHQAANLRFLALDTALFILVRPGWYFTKDGFKPVPGKAMGILSMKWGGRERNAAVLRNVLMWGFLLGNGEQEITLRLGSANAIIKCVPSSAAVAVGIDSDEIRLDRLLSGDGAGEVTAEDELDSIAALREGEDELLEELPADVGGDTDSAEEPL